ncbi:peroxiredoxin [Zavarzinia sp. CC-PAN008]|uniref:peroxiredoxin n=1 Tax=Zavarzinia sp. CC-PAN008 TaxID=3243332 RepID=UPI003F744BEC
MANVGDKAPDITLKLHDGSSVRLSSFQGRQAVVLFFYPKDNTSVCTAEVCAFRDAFEDFSSAGAAVIGISSDGQDSHRGFADKHRLPFLLASDTDKAARKAFGVPNTMLLFPGRVTYVIDKQGTVRHVFNAMMESQGHVDEALRIVKSLN